MSRRNSIINHRTLLLLLILLILQTLSESADLSAPLVLTNATVIDGTGAASQPGMVIIIENDLIRTIAKMESVRLSRKAAINDLNGAYVLPGFINAHVHRAYDAEKLKIWARSGVTTVRDLSDLGRRSPSSSYELRNRLNRNHDQARLVAAGPIVTAPGGYGNFHVSSGENAGRKTGQLIDQGADLIKIALEDNLQGRRWPMLSPEIARAIVETAHSRGTLVSCHVSQAHQLALAARIGVNDIAHMIYDSLSDEIIAIMIDKEIYCTPTLELWRGVCRAHQLDWYPRIQKNVRRFYEAGGKIALGTDYGGYIFDFELGMPMKELRLMREAGLSPMDIIVASTRHAAHVCGLDKQLGTIETGKQADLIVMKRNPLEDLEALSHLEMVIRRGKIIRQNDSH